MLLSTLLQEKIKMFPFGGGRAVELASLIPSSLLTGVEKNDKGLFVNNTGWKSQSYVKNQNFSTTDFLFYCNTRQTIFYQRLLKVIKETKDRKNSLLKCSS